MDDEVEILDEMAQDQVHYGRGGEEDWQSEGSEGEEDQGDEILLGNDTEAIVRPPGGSDEAPEPGYEDRDDGFIDDMLRKMMRTTMTMTWMKKKQ